MNKEKITLSLKGIADYTIEITRNEDNHLHEKIDKDSIFTYMVDLDRLLQSEIKRVMSFKKYLPDDYENVGAYTTSLLEEVIKKEA